MAAISDLAPLHAVFRRRLETLLAELRAAGMLFRPFETFRSAKDQAETYAIGRETGKKGQVRTYAKPWSSFHQYGLAADIILDYRGVGGWDTSKRWIGHWRAMHDAAHRLGLNTLNFELCHVELGGVLISDLRRGVYPAGGGGAWALNLSKAIDDYPAGAPPKPKGE